MKTIIKSTLAAIALVVGASASQAQPVVKWHFPYKAAPYGVWVEPAQKVAPVKIVRHGKHVHKLIAGKTQVIR